MADRAQNIKIAPHDAYFEGKETFCADFAGLTGANMDQANILFYLSTGECISAWWGTQQSQIESWDFAGLTGADFDVVGAGKKLNFADGSGYVWINVAFGGVNGPQSDPGGAGVAIEVQIDLADDANTIADFVRLSDPGGFGSVLNFGGSGSVLTATYIPGVITTPGDAGDSGTAFNIDQTGVDGIDPTPGGCTSSLVETLDGSETALQLATTFHAYMDANYGADYVNTLDGTTVISEKIDFQVIPQDANAPSFPGTFALISKGCQVYLGLLDGDITVTPSAEFTDVQAHQTGLTLLARLMTSAGATVDLTLKECTKAIYSAMIKVLGSEDNSVANPTVGYGTAKVSANILRFAKRLRLTPVGATDNSNDFMFWKTIPEIGGITLSGENPQIMPLSFTAFPDATKDPRIDIWMLGDWTQY